MPVRTANAEWNGALMDGKGAMAFGSGAFDGPFSYRSRMEEGPGTNPEELIGAAHAGCFSMQFSAMLDGAGHTPESVRTQAKVRFDQQDEGWAITRVDLISRARVPGIDEARFQEVAQAAKEACPVSQALRAVEITLDAQ